MAIKQTYISDQSSIPTTNLITGTATKIGIQASAGSSFLLDTQEIKIGRSGVYEIEGVEIKEVKYQTSGSPFMPIIIDYITEDGVTSI